MLSHKRYSHIIGVDFLLWFKSEKLPVRESSRAISFYATFQFALSSRRRVLIYRPSLPVFVSSPCPARSNKKENCFSSPQHARFNFAEQTKSMLSDLLVLVNPRWTINIESKKKSPEAAQARALWGESVCSRNWLLFVSSRQLPRGWEKQSRPGNKFHPERNLITVQSTLIAYFYLERG